MGALGADRAGKPGAYPCQVISAIIPVRRVGSRIVLTWCGCGGRGGYGRGGRVVLLALRVSVPDVAPQ